MADDGEANITIPFPFTFYGVTSSNLRVGNNGGILFNATTGDVGITNAALPVATPALAILPFWDDIDADTGDVYWEVQGTAPNRILIVEWYNRPHFSNVGSATFEVILYEGTNEIKFQYLTPTSADATYNFGVSATAGINKDATRGLAVLLQPAGAHQQQGDPLLRGRPGERLGHRCGDGHGADAEHRRQPAEPERDAPLAAAGHHPAADRRQHRPGRPELEDRRGADAA